MTFFKKSNLYFHITTKNKTIQDWNSCTIIGLFRIKILQIATAKHTLSPGSNQSIYPLLWTGLLCIISIVKKRLICIRKAILNWQSSWTTIFYKDPPVLKIGKADPGSSSVACTINLISSNLKKGSMRKEGWVLKNTARSLGWNSYPHCCKKIRVSILPIFEQIGRNCVLSSRWILNNDFTSSNNEV